jgi:hypothetical protein
MPATPPAVGISPALQKAWLNTLRNEPFTVSMTCMQLHIGIPGSDGMQLPSVLAARTQFVYAGATDSGILITGTPPMFLMTDDEVISHVSVWSGFEGDPAAIFLFSAALKVPKSVANGDRFTVNSSDLAFNPNSKAA